ncbi:methylated-DNA--[protein]-cysteine S-methyltransferase [uncultured Agrococcus sp.]|uniref:methylated-DNA--[protein]-cysteine S-methyltransferase n=1 Tax=uncultured Agrococcus sp. TaxID=382258 RepID=UPI0025E15A2B|nr:methylated-DNA--[protein]-cysteine S-methyltransferase [uncultured Agrococcus sp.]
MTTTVTTSFETPHGPFTVIAREGVVFASGWTGKAGELLPLIHRTLRPEADAVEPVPTNDERVRAIADAVTQYYEGDFEAAARVPVQQHSGEFRMLAWDALRQVTPGAPITYTEFANRAGRPAAVRAAASACAMNAAALFVPCHRILRSDGTLGGFRYGTDIKDRLLALERRG